MCESPYVKAARGQTYYTDENGNWVDACDFEISPELFAVRLSNDPVTAVGNATIRAMTSDADLSYSGQHTGVRAAYNENDRTVLVLRP